LYQVPNAWLDAFFYDWQDAPGEGAEVIGVEAGEQGAESVGASAHHGG